MTSSPADLRTLLRTPPAHAATRTPTASVPRPRARWLTRVLVPALVLLGAAGLLAYAARDALRPRLAVHVAAAIPVAAGAAAPGEDHHAAGADALLPPSAPADAGGSPGPVLVQAPGWIEPAPYAVSVPALAEGVVREVLVLEGERVEAGQVVARMIADDARLTLRAAEATVAERDADIARARAALATAEAQVRVERIGADELRDEVERKRPLVAGGGVGLGEFRQLEIRLGGLEAKIATAEAQVAEARAMLTQSESAREAALVARDGAALGLSRMEVRSPVAGVVLERLVEPGARISMQDGGGEGGAGMMGVVLRVYDPAALQVRVDVPLADAAKVGVGTRALVTTEALGERAFTGVVTRAVHEANIQRNTVQFKVTLDEPSPVLKPEMLTRVRLYAPVGADAQRQRDGAPASGGSESGALAGENGPALLIPAAALTPTGDGAGEVWVIDASGDIPVARRRAVSTAPYAADPALDAATHTADSAAFVLVTRGLRLTDRVIIDAPTAIREGVRLRVLGERTGPAPTPSPTATSPTFP